ncbi:hypothetical protein [Arthrobacter sp. CG_A4]|uniref:hypothetical protein n=1 Tax=Arthrobacter sp. CG_A4 TaxID=3071706 RepID=UPI002E11D085
MTIIDDLKYSCSETDIDAFWFRDLPGSSLAMKEPGSLIDPFVLASYVGACLGASTQLGIAVSGISYRSALVTANAALSLALILHRPFRLGLGTGERHLSSAEHTGQCEKHPKSTLPTYFTQVSSLIEGQDHYEITVKKPSSLTEKLEMFFAQGSGSRVVDFMPHAKGRLLWQQAPDELMGKLKEGYGGLTTAMTLNVHLDEAQTKPVFVRKPVSLVALPPAKLRSVLDIYRQCELDEIILNLHGPESRRKKFELLAKAKIGPTWDN